jgi:hypothetical protein
MSDPLFHDPGRDDRIAADPDARPAALRMQWLKLATGVLALVLLLAIWLVWRWG